jgi:1,4-alpha-glucan branching enzyme
MAGKCTIGIIGRITEQKGRHDIIKPMKKLLNEFPGTQFLTAGTRSDDEYATHFIDSFKGFKNFRFVGFVDNIYKDFLSRCDIVLIPSIHESGSIVCLETMAAGKAVIASDINPHNEYIRTGRNGYLIKNNDDYYTVSKNLIENPSLIKKIGDRARISVSDYDWDEIGERVEDIYNEIRK